MVEGSCELVAFPASTDDVVACMRAAREHGLAVVPRGSGTGLAGAATPIGDALVVVTTKMTRVLEVRPEDRLAWVEPGRANLDLSVALRPHGFTFAPDPSSQQSCSIGGNVSNERRRAALPRVRRDERARARPRGRAARRLGARGSGRRARGRRATTCAACSSAARARSASRRGVRAAHADPPAVRTMLLDFDDRRRLRRDGHRHHRRGVVPAALEMMDRRHDRALSRRSCTPAIPTDAAAVLLVEVDGMPRRRRRATPQRVEVSRAANGARTIRVAADEAERRCCGRAASRRSGRSRASRPHYYLHDSVVPRTRLVEVLAASYAIARAPRPHRHERLPRGRRQPASAVLVRRTRARHDRARATPPARRSCGCASTRAACCRGEHGIGLEKRDFMPLHVHAPTISTRRHACARRSTRRG